MEPKHFFLFITLAVFQLQLSFAQFEIKTTETIQTDSTLQEARTGLFYYKNSTDFYFNNTTQNASKTYHFSVVLTNGDTINIKSPILFSEDKHYVLNNGGKIYPENTTEIIAHFEEYDFTGIPNDSCWLFRCNDDDNDPIYTYSFLPEDKSRYVLFAKLKNSNTPPETITTTNIIRLVQADKTALEFAVKHKLIAAIKQYNIRNYATLK